MIVITREQICVC